MSAARRPFVVVAVASALVAGMWIGSPSTPALAQAADDSISERLAALEKAIIRNPAQPGATVLARLGAIEKLLQEQSKNSDKAADETKKAAAAVAAEQDRVDRRMKILENNDRENARNELSDQLKDLKRDLAGFQQTIKDLTDRVRKLESRI